MNTLIVYATKHGAAGEIARRIGKRIEGATVCDLKGSVPALDGFDCVVLGSSVYAGRLRKEAKAFAEKHAAQLMGKRIGLYVSGLQPDGEEGFLTANYPKELVAHASAKAMLGGIADPSKESFFERLLMRVITKSGAYKSTISEEKIGQFAERLRP